MTTLPAVFLHTARAVDKPLPPPPAISLATPSDNAEHRVHNNDESHMSRAASYTALPLLIQDEDTSIKRTFSENVLSISSESPRRPPPEEQASGKEILRRASTRRANGSPVVREKQFDLSPEENVNVDDLPFGPKVAVAVERVDRHQKSRSMSGTIGSFARKSWFSASPTRSPSPSPVDDIASQERSRNVSPQKKLAAKPPKSPKKPKAPRTLEDIPPSRDQAKVVSRKGTVLERTRRPLSVLLPQRKPDVEPALRKSPSSYSLRKSMSMEKMLLQTRSKPPAEKVPPVPHSFSTERLHALGLDYSKKKDELWNVFRTLEGDYSKFQSKTSPLKANVVRSSLLPFLHRYANHPSFKSLRPEDLDRRINILNKWWTGLLEMLNGKNNQAINGVDRPVFLEGVAGIMTRPEWRIPPFPSPAVTPTEKPDKARKPSLKSRSTTSLESGGSDFLVESIYHNIRNIFIQNLLSQMAFVVERMSMKTAPASLVSFCGKATAYAFFFCPGVADILIRLWETTQSTIRATLKIYVDTIGIRLTSTSKDVSAPFPPPLRPLAFSSYTSFVKYMREKVPLPLGAGNIRWNSPGWKRRWSGRDSDLFFVFVKHFYILVTDFFPADAHKNTRVCIPGLISVHGQILTVLEDNLRKGGQLNFEAPMTFDDVLDGGADASAATLPMAVTGVRSMAESRLIILIRDFLAESAPELESGRKLFAESFAGILKAVARKTSQFDSFTCYSFCDFLDEVIAILYRHRNSAVVDCALIDWPFWLHVCQKMMESHNTLTEVRVFTFLFTNWNTLVADDGRKRDLCLGWLLKETFFRAQFNHWCPMVRGYFQRLLCWRLARYDGEATDLDAQIYETFLERLRQNWSYVLFLQKKAEAENTFPPSTAPCSPAPRRRLIILRNDTPPPSGNLFVSFDKVVPNSSSTQPTAYKRDSLMQSLNQVDHDPSPTQKAKRWSILKTIFPTTNGDGRPGEVTPPHNRSEDSLPSLDAGGINGQHSSNPNDSQVTLDIPDHQLFSFRFSLEWVDRPMFPSKNKRLSTPCLPDPAHTFLQSRGVAKTEVTAVDPKGIPGVTIKYAGRALAEWTQIVSECQNFFDRRKDEGVPLDRLVETPTLAADNFQHP